MTRVIPECLAVIALGSVLQSQAAIQKETKCLHAVVQAGPKGRVLHAPDAGNYKGYKRAPIVAFEVDNSGVIQHANIKRRSGSGHADELALNWVRGLQYNPRPGCGIVESEAAVIIDFTSR